MRGSSSHCLLTSGRMRSYCQLKKSIRQVVRELRSLGFSPELVRDLAGQGGDTVDPAGENHSGTTVTTQPRSIGNSGLRLAYDVDSESGHLVPRLRLTIDDCAHVDTTPYVSVLASLEDFPANPLTHEYIIPLASDAAFFDLLTGAMNSMSAQLTIVHSQFMAGLGDLSKSISASALPMSRADPSYRPFSIEDDPALISIPSTRTAFRAKLDDRSDLYMWRQLLGLYIETEVFDSVAERDRGERSLEDTETRLEIFLDKVEKNGILKGKSERAHLGVKHFIRLNNMVLDLKRLNYATSEAARKILKKHTKQTSLPFPPSLPQEIISAVNMMGVEVPTTVGPSPEGQISRVSTPSLHHCGSLQQLLAQAIGDIILPIIPQIDDYSCVICTSIAFKPIRLSCGHLFCVRCLVKMQKQGNGNCPVCRSCCVLTAGRSNVDWALMNFMADWFPVESREKLLSNEQEVNAELAQELFGKGACLVM